MLCVNWSRWILAVVASCALVVGLSRSAQAADETTISFSGAGSPTFGFGDLEQNVRDTSSRTTDWSVFSTVNAGTAYCVGTGLSPPCSPGDTTNYLPDVQTDIGSTDYATSPLTVNYARQLNSVHVETDPVSPGGYGTLDWVHETATATWAPPGDPGGGSHGTWYTLWHTYPRAGDTLTSSSCSRTGDGLFNLGWIGLEALPNDSSVSYPLPLAQSSLPQDSSGHPGYETRLFAGTDWDSTDSGRIGSTSDWSTGLPARPPTGLSSDPYDAWSEPSVLYDPGSGSLLVVMTGREAGPMDTYGCPTSVGDIWLFSYSFSTSTWSTGCKLLDHTWASLYGNSLVPNANYTYLTASSLFWDPSVSGQLDMVVSPVDRVDRPSGGPVDVYNGELLFGLGGSGGCPSLTYVTNLSPVSPYESNTTFIGAGGFLWSEFDASSTVEFQMHKYCTATGVFKVGAWVSGSFSDLC